MEKYTRRRRTVELMELMRRSQPHYDEMIDFANHAAAYAVVSYQTATLNITCAALMVMDNVGQVFRICPYLLPIIGIPVLPSDITRGQIVMGLFRLLRQM